MLDDGIERAKKSNSKGILGLLNLLGEDIKSKTQVKDTVSEYSRLLERIAQSKVSSQISIKPTQLGLAFDPEYCLQNYQKIAEDSKSYSDNFLWVDMEGSPFTQKTIDLYKQILAKYPKTGIAIQAYLKRSERDLRELLPLGAKVRLVKGAYNEPAEIAMKTKKEISENYSKLTRILFEDPGRNFFAVATHDGKLVDVAKELSRDNANFEFEMLMGVRDRLKAELVQDKFQVREYIPYGPEWFAYSMRRLREKRSNILLLVRSLFSS